MKKKTMAAWLHGVVRFDLMALLLKQRDFAACCRTFPRSQYRNVPADFSLVSGTEQFGPCMTTTTPATGKHARQRMPASASSYGHTSAIDKAFRLFFSIFFDRWCSLVRLSAGGSLVHVGLLSGSLHRGSARHHCFLRRVLERAVAACGS